ncbi:MAG TPA: hypothetical protein VF316_16275, partial [Polyangiaceae bacterium]
RPLAYLTDVEGRWDKLARFAAVNPYVELDADGRLQVSPESVFVFGGDAIDRGPDAMRIVDALVDAAERQPERVVLLAGNRDINKLRLPRELSGAPPASAPADLPPPALLRWIFTNTMGAKDAFDMRAAELARGRTAAVDGDEIVASFLADVTPDGPLTRYLTRAVLAFREGSTLVVHGAVTEGNLGVVPGDPREDDVDTWIAALNRWYAQQLDAFRAAPRSATSWAALRAYHAPLPGTRANVGSVVYGRHLDAAQHATLPPRATRERLTRAGISRLLVGHTPVGDAPAILRAADFELIMADNSYGRLEHGASVVVRDERVMVDAYAKLDDGSEERVSCDVRRGDPSPIGKRDPITGHLVKGRLAGGRWHLHRPLGDLRVEQVAVTDEALEGRELVAPE